MVRRRHLSGFVDGMTIALDPRMTLQSNETGPNTHAQLRIKPCGPHPPPQHHAACEAARARNPAADSAQRQRASMPVVGRFQSQSTRWGKSAQTLLRLLDAESAKGKANDDQSPSGMQQISTVSWIEFSPARNHVHVTIVGMSGSE